MDKERLKLDIQKLVRKYYPKIYPEKEFVPGKSYIPVSYAIFDHLEVESLLYSSIHMKMVDGELVNRFEREMARFVGTRLAIMCNSGSSANLLALMTLTSPRLGSKALQSGDEVITSAVGFPTTVSPIIWAGCVPVFTDVSLSTYNPTPAMISEAITEKTKAIFLAHTMGNPFDLDEIREIADQNSLWLIEDGCDSLLATYDGHGVGTIGDLSTTSFYPAHQMMVGEGGMVFTNSPMLNKIVRSFRDWGRNCTCLPGKDNTCGKRFCQSRNNLGDLPDGYDHKYVYSHVGFNLKSTDLQASIGLEQVKKLPDFVERRRHNWLLLHSEFVDAGLDKFFILPTHHAKANPSPFGFVLTIKETAGFTRSELVQYLENYGIGTRNLFGGNLTRQPAFTGKGRISDGLPKADIVMTSAFWIGCHPGITDEMIDWILECFVTFIKEHNERL